MEYQLPIREYNQDKLTVELEGLCNGFVIREDTYYAIIPDDATDEQKQQITDIANAHDPSPTDAQKSVLAEEAIKAQITRSKECLHLIAPIYNQRAIDLNRPYGEITAIDAYNNVKAVINATWNEQTELGAFLINYMRNLCWQHYNIDYNTPPIEMTTNYANKFLQATYEVIDSINAQYKF